MEHVGARVRALRQAQHLTQRQLADRAGLYHTTISELELGITMPGLPTLSKLATALGVSVTVLLLHE